MIIYLFYLVLLLKMTNQIHVLPKWAQGWWAVKKSNNSRASGIYSTQQEAKKEATKIAKNEWLELLIHNKEGKIREKNSYGKDPHPPRW